MSIRIHVTNPTQRGKENETTNQESALCSARFYLRRASGAGRRSSATQSSEDADRRLGRGSLVSIVGWEPGRVSGRHGVPRPPDGQVVHDVELEGIEFQLGSDRRGQLHLVQQRDPCEWAGLGSGQDLLE